MSDEFRSDEHRFIAQAKQVLDRAVDEVDQAHSLRLQRARLRAINRQASRKGRLLWVGGLAMASITALALLLWVTQPIPEPHTAVPLEDFELVTSVENVELAEDLDFYHWLADDDRTG